MQIFLSTTFSEDRSVGLEEVLSQINDLDIDGIELGSTHRFEKNFEEIIKSYWNKRLLTHNFFPPSKESDFFVNLASGDEQHRQQSVDFAKDCMKFAGMIGAEIYTVHPGFLANPKQSSEKNSANYDMQFSKNEISRKKAFSNMLQSLEELVEFRQKIDIKLAIETEGSRTKPGIALMETIDEYDELLKQFPNSVKLNLNIAHTSFAASIHGYNLFSFLERYEDSIVAVELSDNDGFADEHKPIVSGSYVFDYLNHLPDVPLILEFRDASIQEIKNSLDLIRRAKL
tara:strand:+ start:2002 stop:2859 length:858 start_codon:yes stop_codon:yes gene_type:complete